MAADMTSTRPYLLRAMYEWIVDNGCTPHLLVDATLAGVVVPRQYVDKGVIVLNVAPSAVRDLELGNEQVSFSARFAGTPQEIRVPVPAVQAIYARENGQGIFLGEQNGRAGRGEAAPAEPAAEDKPAKPGKAPHLTIVK
jgi:stringent starvation protein B